MASLEVMQRYAERCALKLGVDTPPVLRWSSPPCSVKGRTLAHCHIRDSEYPRGTICVRRGLEDWRATIAHEVTHLKVQAHNSLGFARHLVALGQADGKEKRLVLAHKRHVHKWNVGYSWTTQGPHRSCSICGKGQVGTITWKDEDE